MAKLHITPLNSHSHDVRAEDGFAKRKSHSRTSHSFLSDFVADSDSEADEFFDAVATNADSSSEESKLLNQKNPAEKDNEQKSENMLSATDPPGVLRPLSPSKTNTEQNDKNVSPKNDNTIANENIKSQSKLKQTGNPIKNDCVNLQQMMENLTLSKNAKAQKPKHENGGFFQNLKQAQDSRKYAPPGQSHSRLTPYNETAWKTNPFLNANLTPQKQQKLNFELSSPSSSPAKSSSKKFDSASASFAEPMTPKSSQWSKKIDISALRKPVSININSQPAENDQSEMLSKEQLILSGKMPYQLQQKQTADLVLLPGNVAAGNSYGYVSPEKAQEQIKRLLEEFDGNIKLTDEEISSFPGVEGLTVDLLPHQIHGLKFLQAREKSDLSVRGGFLCDDMGLGKTIQSIALILSNPYDERIAKEDEEINGSGKISTLQADPEDEEDQNVIINSKKHRKSQQKNMESTITSEKTCLHYSHATLVVAPLALASQWAEEIRTKAPKLKVVVHHGPARAKSIAKLNQYDVVITTYQIVTSDYAVDGPLFNQKWWRVIIDEAHSIKNRTAKSAIATSKLLAYARWCLTGTPIQNNVDELFSLIRFLHLNPFDIYTTWSSQISRPLNSGNGNKAIQKLHVILQTVMLRRTKDILAKTGNALPNKNIHRLKLEFQPYEKKVYESLRNLTKRRMNILIEEKGGASYLESLVLLLRLRQICDHVGLIKEKSVLTEPDPLPHENSEKITDGITDELADLMNDLDISQTTEESFLEVEDESCDLSKESTKIKQLLMILKKDPQRKTIVFSQFTAMFDLIEPSLKREGIRYARFDGAMRPVKREEALSSLRNDEQVQVLLCSLRCGALGLNLTVANQVVLLDPWWNPMISEQAVDRVHRIGQKHDVDVYELVMKNSVEEEILLLQEKKRQLAETIIKKTNYKNKSLSKSEGKISLQEIAALFN